MAEDVRVGEHLLIPAGTPGEGEVVQTLEVESGENHFVKSGFSVGILAGRLNLSPSDAKTFIDLKEKLKNNTGVGLKRAD